MKEKSCSLKARVVALILLIPFTVLSCPLPSLSRPSASDGDTQGWRYVSTSRALTFYVTDDYLPSEEPTGKTAFILENVEAAKNFVITAEEEEAGTVVRFLSGDTKTIVSLYFARDNPFPRGFAMNADGDLTYGVFSAYNTDGEETFDLTLKKDGEDLRFDGIVMNKNVLAAYTDDPALTAGENARMRDYVSALGVWMAVTLHIEAETAGEEQEAAALTAAGGGYAINASWILTGGAGDFFRDVGNGFKKALGDLSGVGQAVASFFGNVFIEAVMVVKLIGVVVGATVSLPAVAIIAGVTAVVATVIYLAEIGKEDDIDRPPAEPAPSGISIPLFRLYYFNESGEERLVPIVRTDNDSPTPEQSVYIRPNGHSYDYTSNVRFYYEAAKSA